MQGSGKGACAVSYQGQLPRDLKQGLAGPARHGKLGRVVESAQREDGAEVVNQEEC